jgi:hypothetical protein
MEQRPLTRIKASVLMESNCRQKSPGVQRQNEPSHEHAASKGSGAHADGKLYPAAGKAPPLHAIKAGAMIHE